MTETTAAEFRCLRESLGISSHWLAAHLEVAERTVLRWEFGRNPLRDYATDALAAIAADADALTDELAAPGVTVVYTYRTDEDYHAREPGARYPASWHRAAAWRAARRLGAQLDYHVARQARQVRG